MGDSHRWRRSYLPVEGDTGLLASRGAPGPRRASAVGHADAQAAQARLAADAPGVEQLAELGFGGLRAPRQELGARHSPDAADGQAGDALAAAVYQRDAIALRAAIAQQPALWGRQRKVGQPRQRSAQGGAPRRRDHEPA